MEPAKEWFKKLQIVYKQFLSSPLAIVLSVYIISILLIGPWLNFPVNDDFYYLTQVKAFSMGILTKSALINPAFILQGFMGLLWGKIFGLSYTSLRALTVIISILTVIGINKILKLLGVKNKIRVIALLLTTFNPFFYASSLTFMTENYFLVFVIWSLYFFLLFTKSGNKKFLLLSSIIGGMSIMVRQFGVVLFITYLSVCLFIKIKKINFSELLHILIPFLFLGGTAILWPRYKYMSDPKSMNLGLFFTSFSHIVPRLTSIWVTPYIGYFLFPFTIPIFIKFKKSVKAAVLFVSLFLAYSYYKLNLFSIGNLFYFDGLYARLEVNVRENLFNNIPFKLLMSYLIAVSFTTLVFYLVKRFIKVKGLFALKKIHTTIPKKEDSYYLIFLLFLIGFYLVTMVTDKLYDRYLINFFIILIIFISTEAEKLNFNAGKVSILICILISTITFLLVFGYYKENQLKWRLAYNLIANQKIDGYQIFLDNTYVRSTYMLMNKNYDGKIGPQPLNYYPLCFVQEYTIQSKNFLQQMLTYIESKARIQKYFSNPLIKDAYLLKGLSKKFKPATDALYYDVEYPSPVYNLLGTRTFVRAFCIGDSIIK